MKVSGTNQWNVRVEPHPPLSFTKERRPLRVSLRMPAILKVIPERED